jgi:hypothetical protein
MPITSSAFPSALNMLQVDTSVQGSLVNSIINALEKKLGVDSSKDTNSIDYKTGVLMSSSVTPVAAGTMTVTMNKSVYTITPTNACTFNASGGIAGQYCTFVITTSGASSFTLTWSTNFKVTGTLATGTSSGKVFTIEFVYDGTNWNETSRTVAM